MFHNINALYLLIIVPFFVFFMILDLIRYISSVKKVTAVKKPTIVPYYSEGQKWVKIFFYTFSMVLVILALARPKWGTEEIEVKDNGRDIYFLVDVSISMSTKDLVVSRMEFAKKIINDYLASGINDRVGLRVFAGESVMLVPLTTDYGSISFFLEQLKPGYLEKQGTDIGTALLETVSEFEFIPDRVGTIVLITDGEDLENNISRAIPELTSNGIIVNTIGIGTPNGQPIPVYDENGQVEGFVKYNDQFVVSKLDESTLKSLANQTGGRSVISRINDNNPIASVIDNQRSGVNGNNNESVKITQMKERYYIFLIPALVFLSLGFILDQGKLFRWGKAKGMFIFLIFFVSFNNAVFAGDNSADHNFRINSLFFPDRNAGFWGNRAFLQERYYDALSNYYKGINVYQGDDLARLWYNIGVTQYKIAEYENSISSCRKALEITVNPQLVSKINYQIGLSLFRGARFTDSARSFLDALLSDPSNEEARVNYYIAKILSDENQDENEEEQENQDQENTGSDQRDQEMLRALEQMERMNNAGDQMPNSNSFIGKYW